MVKENYLALEPLIIDRLRDEIRCIDNIFSGADLASVKGCSQIVPALHVLYMGDRIPGGEGSSACDGADQVLTQLWAVVVAVNNVTGILDGSEARQEAGPLISQVLETLQGWKPAQGFRALKRTTGPGPNYVEGFFYMPLVFECVVIF